MLQTMVPYKTAVELCAIERGGPAQCQAGERGIRRQRLTLCGEPERGEWCHYADRPESLTGLTVAMLPIWNAAEGALSWQRSCTSDNTSLRDSCLEQFRFADKEENNG